MNTSRKSLTIAECKIQASILLKSLHSDNSEIAKQAAKRFQRLSEFTEFSLEQIIAAEIKRKHALTVIAIEKSFKSWLALKSQLPFIIVGFLNKWFVSYNEARFHLESDGGFLLPYKNQYFICGSNYIKQLGLNPNDSDWKLIGYDWANPSDQKAWQRLYKKWMKIQEDNDE